MSRVNASQSPVWAAYNRLAGGILRECRGTLARRFGLLLGQARFVRHLDATLEVGEHTRTWLASLEQGRKVVPAPLLLAVLDDAAGGDREEMLRIMTTALHRLAHGHASLIIARRGEGAGPSRVARILEELRAADEAEREHPSRENESVIGGEQGD